MENPFSIEKFRNLPESGLTEVYVNKRFKLYFDPKDLALFVDRSNGNVPLRSLPYHHRSADVGISTIIHENDAKRKNVYCQFDIKGGGFLFPETHESKKMGVQAGDLAGSPEAHIFPDSPETAWGYDALGLLDERLTKNTIFNANILSAAGMRIEGIVAVYRTDTLFINGEDVSVIDFKKEAIFRFRALAVEAQTVEEKKQYREMAVNIKEEFQPVVMIRAMRSIFRLRDFKNATCNERDVMLKEACENVNMEMKALRRDEHFSVESEEGKKEFLRFIIHWYGKNVGLMHGVGMVHAFLHMGNLSLAGEIVDLDSVQKVIVEKKGVVRINPDIGRFQNMDERFGLPKCILKDMREICFSVKILLRNDFRQYRPEMCHELIDGYLLGLGESEPFERIGLSAEKCRQVFRIIAQEVVAEGHHMPPVQPDILVPV